MKRLIFCLIFILAFSFSFGDTIVADSASYADVAAAVAAADPEDTVRVPAGTETWASQLAINEGISLIGNGIGSTVITNGCSDNLIEISGLAADNPIRVSGFTFTGDDSYSSVYIKGNNDGSWAYTSIRVDNNKFSGGGRALWILRWIYGVADHNQFYNCPIAIGGNGDNNYSWDRTIEAGTANAFFVEDNTFTLTGTDNFNEQIYLQDGARFVVRYNTYACTGATVDYVCVLDSHGNWPYYDDSPDHRAQPILEIYENTFAVYHATRFMYIRGGSNLIYNNAFTQETGSGVAIQFTDEESWQTVLFDPLDDTWPAEDQIMNTFLWGNTLDEVAITAISLNNANDAEFIVEDRDYFMAAPASSGGFEAYTDRQGAAGNAADGTMTFTAEGANAYYPYTPYDYPHPLAESVAIGASAEQTAIDLLLFLKPFIWFTLATMAYAIIRMIDKI